MKNKKHNTSKPATSITTNRACMLLYRKRYIILLEYIFFMALKLRRTYSTHLRHSFDPHQMQMHISTRQKMKNEHKSAFLPRVN